MSKVFACGVAAAALCVVAPAADAAVTYEITFTGVFTLELGDGHPVHQVGQSFELAVVFDDTNTQLNGVGNRWHTNSVVSSSLMVNGAAASVVTPNTVSFSFGQSTQNGQPQADVFMSSSLSGLDNVSLNSIDFDDATLFGSTGEFTDYLLMNGQSFDGTNKFLLFANPSSAVVGTVETITVRVVPAPGAAALLALGGFVAAGGRRRR